MKKFIKYLRWIVTLYLILWTIFYAILMEMDFEYYLEYLWLSWTGPGEKPFFIQFFSVVLTIIITSVFGIWKYFSNKREA